MDRRVFLTNVGAAGAIMGLNPASNLTAAGVLPTEAGNAGPQAAAAAAAAAAHRPISRRLFESALDSRFTIDGHAEHEVELVELVDGPSASGLDQFFVVLREVQTGKLPVAAGNHTLTSARHGQMLLHLEPLTDRPNGTCYRASMCLLA